MKTYDGAELIAKRLAKYPADSLTPREIITTLPSTGDDADLAFRVNSAITQAIYKAAEKFLQDNPQTKPVFKFTAVGDFKGKVDDSKARNAGLSTAVLDALKAI